MFFYNGIKKITVIIFCIFSMLAVSCDMPDDQPAGEEPNLLSSDNKAYVRFNNPTDFDVNVYVNTPPISGTEPSFAETVPQKGNRQFEISPSAAGSNGDTFYFEYLIPLGSVTIPYYDIASVRIKRIIDREINTFDIPALTSSTTTSKFLVVENASDTDIWVQDGNTPLIPYGQQNREISAGQNGVFILPQTMATLSNYTAGAISRRNIPSVSIQPGIIYAFKYDGSSVSLYSESHFNLDDRRKIWSIPTSTSQGQYLQMGKQKPRRNPENGVVILGTLQYSLDAYQNSRAYFALLNQYGEVTSERIFTLPNNPTIYFDDVHERENGDFLIPYRAIYNIGTDDEDVITYLMCYTAAGITKWRVNFDDILPNDLDPLYCDLRLEYIAEKNNKTFAIGGKIWDHWDYVASFVVEVTENAPGTDASFSWSSPYISDFVLYDEDDGIFLTERSCRGLQYSATLDAYIVVEYNIENKRSEGSYKILRAADGSIIRKNIPNEYNRFGFLGISQVGDKYYILGEYQDVNEKFSAAVLRFNSNMTVDTNFSTLLLPSDFGNAELRSSTSDAKKVVFAGCISTQDKFTVPWTYAIDRNTGAKLWENIYDDLDYNIVWNVGLNSIGTLQLELYDWDYTLSSLIASTDLFGRINGEEKAPIPRNPSLTVAVPSYAVTYNINGGTGTTPAAQTVTAGNSVTIAGGSGLSRSGYTFGGWNTNASGTGTNYNAGSSYTPTGNITLYAKWNVATYTVTYNINSGSGTTPSAQTANSGSSITLPSGSGLSRSGYTFGGWNTNTSGTGTNYSAGSSYTVTGNVTLYAKWNVTYTVTFNINSGSGTTPSAQTVNSGSSITLPSGSGLSRTNYTFGGWNTNTSGTGTNYNAGSSYTPTSNITLYAKWTVVTYTVTYNINSGSGTTPSAQTVNAGSSVTLASGNGLSRSGYTFGGWNTNTSGTGTNYNAGSSYTPTGNITLYAKWNTGPVQNPFVGTWVAVASAPPLVFEFSIVFDNTTWMMDSGNYFPYTYTGNTATLLDPDGNTLGTATVEGGSMTVVSSVVEGDPWVFSKGYIVTFSENGGNVTPATRAVQAGSSITLPYEITKSGYTFGGWNTNASGTGVNYSAGSTYTPTGNITLYAKWDAVVTYTVSYNSNSGSGTTPSAQTANSGSSITLPSGSGLFRTGYTFGGWNTNTSGTGTNYSAGSSYTVNANITLYAKWDVVTYTVTFNINSGSGTTPSAQTANSGSAITLPSGSGLSRSGYTFGGWNTNTSGTGTNYSAGSSYTVNANITLYARWDSPGAEFNPLPLTVNTWADGSITSSASGGAVWYSFNVVSGTTYYVWWNDTDNSGGTLDVKVAAYYSSGNNIFDVDNSGTNTHSFTANSTGTVKIKVYPYSSGSTGTFAVAYSTANTRPSVIVSGSTLAAKLSWLQTNAQSNGNYILEVSANESISPHTLSYSGKTNVGITLRGTGAVRTVSLSSNGAMFTVASGVTLTLDNNITLQGRSSNNDSLVRVNSDGTLVMKAGSTVTGNTYYSGSSSAGGGVSVSGTFTMSGGTISGNTASSDSDSRGGGVYVSYGTFTMSGGTISGNRAIASINGSPVYGGGVYVSGVGIFTKTGGTIYGYSASDTVNSNVVSRRSVVSNLGHAVFAYISSSSNKRKETTAGTGVNLSFNGNNDTYSGSWDN